MDNQSGALCAAASILTSNLRQRLAPPFEFVWLFAPPPERARAFSAPFPVARARPEDGPPPPETGHPHPGVPRPGGGVENDYQKQDGRTGYCCTGNFLANQSSKQSNYC